MLTTYHTFLRKTNIFISCWLSRRIKSLSKLISGDAQMLLTIFSPKNKFYDFSCLRGYQFNVLQDLREDLNNSQILIGTENTGKDLWPWELIDKNVSGTSLPKHFVFNVYCFAKLKGFDVCKEFVQGDLKVESLTFVCKVYKAITNMINCMTEEQFESVIMPIVALGLDASQKQFGDTESKLEKPNELCKFIKRLQKMMQNSSHKIPEALLQKATDLHLILAIKLMRSSALECRLKGLKEILKIIKSITTKGAIKDKAANSQIIAEALGKHHIFHHIFAESSLHGEILKKCAEEDLFGFLYAWKQLSMENILLMWNTAISKSGDVELQRCVFQVLTKLVIHFCSVHSKEIFTLLSQIRFGDFNENIISLLVALTKNECLRRSKPIVLEETKSKNSILTTPLQSVMEYDSEENYGEFVSAGQRFRQKEKTESPTKEQDPVLVEDPPGYVTEDRDAIMKHLFSLVQDRCLSEGLDQSLQNHIIEQFLSIVATYHKRISGEDIIAKYITICEEMLARDDSPFQAAKIYIALFSNSPKSKVSNPELLQKLIVNLLKFKLEALNLASKSSANNENLDIPIAGSIRKFSYFEEISGRLNLIGDLICSEYHKLKPWGMQSLCKIFMHNNVSPKEKDLFFSFMQRLSSSKVAHEMMFTGVLNFFYYDILLRLDPKQYTLSAFFCLKNILILLNSHFKRLSNDNNCLVIYDIKLIGTQAVWQIYLKAPDKTVSENARCLILNIYENLSTDLLEREGNTIRKQFIGECMKFIKENFENIQKGNNISQAKDAILNAVKILAEYINDFNEESTKSEPKVINEMIDIHFHYHASDCCCTRLYSVRHDKSLADLFTLFETEFYYHRKCHEILFLFNGEALYPSSATIGSFGFKQEPHIYGEALIRFVEGIPGGKQKEYWETDSIHKLKAMFPGKKQEVYYKALTKSKGELSQAIQVLLDDKEVINIQNEVEKVAKARLAQIYNAKAEKASSILANSEEYFKLFYACLTIDSKEISNRLWLMLQGLPLSIFKRNEMARLICSNNTMTPWNEIFGIDSPYTLSYSLRVFIDILNSSSENSSGQYGKTNRREQATICLTRLIKDKGLNALYNLLISSKNIEMFPTRDHYPQYCVISYIIAIFKECITCSIMDADNTEILYSVKETKGLPEMDLHFDISPSMKKDIREFIKQQDLVPFLQFYITALVKDNEDIILDRGNFFPLMIALMHYNPQLYLPDFYEDIQFFEFLISYLLNSSNFYVKNIIVGRLSTMFNSYYEHDKLDHNQLPPDAQFFNCMLMYLPNPNIDHPNCEAFFNYLITLCKVYKCKKK